MRSLARFVLFAALGAGCVVAAPAPEPTLPVESVVVSQEGTATTFGLSPHEVFYPAPYLSPPSLEVVPEGKAVVMRLEQKADRFVVTAAPGGFGQAGATLKWKARGSVPKSAAPAPPPPAASTFASP